MNQFHIMKSSLDGSVKSVKRALDVLEALAEAHDPPSFLDLMTMLAIPRSSLFHLMGQLISRGYVVEVPFENRYRLGRMPAVIAGLAARRTWLSQTVRPVLRELSERTNEFSAFYVVEGDMVRGMAVQSGTHALSYRIAPNHVAPLYSFAAGKVALADLNRRSLDAYLARVKLEPLTANTITDAAALRAVVARVRETGLGCSRSEFALGVDGFAMGVRHDGSLLGILNVSVPEPRYNSSHVSQITRCLKGAVDRLERLLQYAQPEDSSEDEI